MVEIERSEPIGFYNLGVAYLDVARAAAGRGSSDFADPFEFLISHGLELIFKADLRRSKTLQQVRQEFGHDLEKMLDKLSPEFVQHFFVGRGLRTLVTHLASGHSGPDWHNRYLVTGVRFSQPTVESMLEVVKHFADVERGWLIRHFTRQVQ